MNYLAFDIEAANGYMPSSICSIGIVIADEQFHIIERKNIWINPKTKYNLNGTRQNVGIDLHLDKALLDRSPDFAEVYPEVKRLLTAPDRVVLGHAVDADVRMLNAACERYKLPPIEFDFICSQLLFKLYKGESSVRALGKIAAELGVEFEQHNSEEDAYMSMRTLQYLVEDSGLTVDELLAKYEVRRGTNYRGQLARPICCDNTKHGSIKNKNTRGANARIRAIAAETPKLSDLWEGKIFAFSRTAQLFPEQDLVPLVTAIIEGGGTFTRNPHRCNVFVRTERMTRGDEVRLQRVLTLQPDLNLTVVTAEEVVREWRTYVINKKIHNTRLPMTKAQQFLAKHGQSTDNIDIQAKLQLFLDEMTAGLSGKESSIPMIPTYLQDVDCTKIKKNKRIMLIDAGGTNFRSAIGYFDDNGEVVVDDIRKTSMPAIDRELTKEQFYAQIAENVRYLADETGDVGFCFSYNVDMDKDVDGKVVVFSKEVKAPEVIGTRVGAETLAAIRVYSDKPRKIVILNDTVATLLGGMAQHQQGYSSYVGYIFGTGTNACYIEDTANITKVQGLSEGKMLINTESGGFDGFEQGDFDKIVSDNTTSPGKQLLEKMTSGRYLSDVIAEALRAAIDEGLFVGKVAWKNFVLKDVSEFVEGDNLVGMFDNDEDKAFAKEICTNLIDRSARIGAIMNAAMCIVSCHDKNLPVGIVCEGTTFNKLPGYRTNFEKYLHVILDPKGVKFEILQGRELNLIGTLMATQIL